MGILGGGGGGGMLGGILGGGGGGGMPGMGMGGGGMLGFLSGGNTPQDRGFGIADPSEFVGYSTGAGLMEGDPTGMESLDLTGPGAAEQFFGANSGALMSPGMGEGFAQGAMGRYGGGADTPDVSNLAGDAYQSFVGAKPTLRDDPGLEPYFENAKRRAGESINKEMSARGMYGSSAATDQISEAFTNLEAERANREADYGLKRLAEQRGWEGLGGELGRGADISSMGQSQNELGWLQGLGGIANQGQAQELARLGLGGNLASDAQRMQMQRAQQLFGNEMGLGNQLSDVSGQAYDQMIGGDQALLDSILGMELGLGAEALNQDYRGQQRIKDDISWAADTMGSVMTMGLM